MNQRRIACIGWGSLIWDPRSLPIEGMWLTDGPNLPIEFTRESSDGRMTLAITPGYPEVQTLWIPMRVDGLAVAIESLRIREGPTRREWIGTHPDPLHPTDIASTIAAWAQQREIAGAVWTELPPKFRGEDGRVPTAEEVLEHLTTLTGQARAVAERYVRCAPEQIRTAYRQEIETRLGWTHIKCGGITG